MKKILFSMSAMLLSLLILSGCAAGQGFSSEKDITVVSREDGSGTRGAFIELMKIEKKEADGNRKDRTTKEALVVSKTDVVMTNITGDKYAIGYISLGSLNDSVKALMVNGAEANAENIKEGSYVLARPFNIATKGEPTALAIDFINFVLSKEGQEVVAKSYVRVQDDAMSFQSSNPSGKIVIAGSSSVNPIMEKLVEAYIRINPQANIEIQSTDSTSGINSVQEGTSHIAMTSRALTAAEKESLEETTIALDGIVMVVNSENPLEDISSEEIQGIFMGELTKWNQVIK